MKEITQELIDKTYIKLKKETEEGGYFLNPDEEFTKDLIEGLLINEERYGYWACPCRLANGTREKDMDIICPCYYRDPDIHEYDACFCALYVSEKAFLGEKRVGTIPERRFKKMENVMETGKNEENVLKLTYPVWRCQVCGYLCAKNFPPEICPVCKARKDRFEKFIY